MYINIIISKALDGLTWDGILTLFTSLIAIFISVRAIKQAEYQFKESKRLDIKPYFNCKVEPLDFSSFKNFEELNNDLHNLKWNQYFISTRNTFNEGHSEDFKTKLILNNIGLGHAIDCKIMSITGMIEEKAYEYHIGEIQTNDSIQIGLNFKYFIEEKIKKIVGRSFDSIEEFEIFNESIKQETTEKIYINLKYIDLLENEYKKTICIAFCCGLIMSANIYDKEIRNIKCTDICREVKFVSKESKEVGLNT